jgi:AcrR family transcriptional regulator
MVMGMAISSLWARRLARRTDADLRGIAAGRARPRFPITNINCYLKINCYLGSRRSPPVPRLNREESQARTRNLLIEAARAEIVRRGFAQASVRDIAEAAGFSQGAFYSNFPDKEAILIELVQRHQAEERARIEAALGAAKGNAATAMAQIEKWAATINADPDAAILSTELQLQALRSPSFAQAYTDLNRKHRRALATIIAKLFEMLGRKPPADPADLATGFIALGRGMALMSKDFEPNRTGRIIVTFLKALIGAVPMATKK